MLKVNRKVEYGLVALKHMLAKPKGQLTSVREICEHYGTPFDPVAHALRILNSQGLVQSEQGAHGGYRLLEAVRTVNFADFIEMIEGQLAFTDCLREEEDHACSMSGRCNIIHPMQTFHRKLMEFLRAMPLVEMLQDVPPLALGKDKEFTATA